MLKLTLPPQIQQNSTKVSLVSELPKVNHSIQPNFKSDYFQASACQIHLDYSHQQVTLATLTQLKSLSEQYHLQRHLKDLFNGKKLNTTENLPALHTALRAQDDNEILVDEQNIMPNIIATREQMKIISEKIRANAWLGYSGKPITSIVNIGIGGSDLGPKLGLSALQDLVSNNLNYYFISDADPNAFKQTVINLNPETTLFIIVTKSFTTQETLYNARKALSWIGSDRVEKHFIAITSRPERAHKFGINTVLPIWDWVGGRFSFCSAVNLICVIAVGYDAFSEILNGARHMDEHAYNSPFESNLPMLLALLGIWNNNFLHTHQLLILTYARELESFVPFIQQLEMESNGKSIDRNGKPVSYATNPIVWGGLGNQAQHSYYQLLCQGTHKICADFITLDMHNEQLINKTCSDKIKTLTKGIKHEFNLNEHIPGKMSLNHIRIKDLSPFSLGALVAMYEHKVFLQSVIWNINPFDQPGVDSAKQACTYQTI